MGAKEAGNDSSRARRLDGDRARATGRSAGLLSDCGTAMKLLHKFTAQWARPNTRPHHAPDREIDWRETVRRRVGVTTGLFVLWAFGIEAKLIHLQVFQRAGLEARARDQQQRIVTDPATRGEILDRYGHILATSADVDSI